MALLGHQALLSDPSETPQFTFSVALTVGENHNIGEETPSFTVSAALTPGDIQTYVDAPLSTFSVALTPGDVQTYIEAISSLFNVDLFPPGDRQDYVDTPSSTWDVAFTVQDGLDIGEETPEFTVTPNFTVVDELLLEELPNFTVDATYTNTDFQTYADDFVSSFVVDLTQSDSQDYVDDIDITFAAALTVVDSDGSLPPAFPQFTVTADLTISNIIQSYVDDIELGPASFQMGVTDTEAGEAVRESPEIVCTGSDFTHTLITWVVHVPAGAAFTVETSTDGGSNWFAQTSGTAITNLPGSPDGVTLLCRQVFTSNEGGVYPTLSYLRIEIGEPIYAESGSVSYNYTPPRVEDQSSPSSVRRTGQLTLTEPVPAYLDPGVALLKPYVEMQAPSTGNWVRFYLGEFRTLAPRRNELQDRVQTSFRMASREQLYAKATTTDWVVAPYNRNIVLFVREDVLVPEFGETQFNFPATTDFIPQDLVFPPGTPWLEVMNAALESAGWDALTVNGDGENTSQPAVSTKASEWSYPSQTPVIKAANVEPFTGDIPNVLVFRPHRGPSLPVEGNGIFTVKNFNTGPFSINQRGGLELTEEVTVEASDQEQLARLGLSIAESRFAGGGDRLQMTVGMNPLHGDQDSVTVTKTDLGITDGRFWVTGWKADLGPIDRMATMALTLEKMVTGVDAANDPTAGASDAGVASEVCVATTDETGAGGTVNALATDSATSVSAAQPIVDGGAPP